MKQIYLLLSCFLIIGCKDTIKTKPNPLQKDSITQLRVYNKPEKKINDDIHTLILTFKEQQNQIKSNIKEKSNLKINDSLFIEYFTQLNRVVDSINKKTNLIENKTKATLKKLGLYISKSNHKLKVHTSTKYFTKLFENKLPPSTKKLLKLIDKTNQTLTRENSHTLLSKLLINWEKYIETLPDSIIKNYAKEKYNQLLLMFLFGDDLNKTFDPSTNKFNEYIEQNFVLFIKRYPKTKTAENTRLFLKFFYEFSDKSNVKDFYKNLYNHTLENLKTTFINE